MHYLTFGLNSELELSSPSDISWRCIPRASSSATTSSKNWGLLCNNINREFQPVNLSEFSAQRR
jgi:hypothetical protein